MIKKITITYALLSLSLVASDNSTQPTCEEMAAAHLKKHPGMVLMFEKYPATDNPQSAKGLRFTPGTDMPQTICQRLAVEATPEHIESTAKLIIAERYLPRCCQQYII